MGGEEMENYEENEVGNKVGFIYQLLLNDLKDALQYTYYFIYLFFVYNA